MLWMWVFTHVAPVWSVSPAAVVAKALCWGFTQRHPKKFQKFCLTPNLGVGIKKKAKSFCLRAFIVIGPLKEVEAKTLKVMPLLTPKLLCSFHHRDFSAVHAFNVIPADSKVEKSGFMAAYSAKSVLHNGTRLIF